MTLEVIMYDVWSAVAGIIVTNTFEIWVISFIYLKQCAAENVKLLMLLHDLKEWFNISLISSARAFTTV